MPRVASTTGALSAMLLLAAGLLGPAPATADATPPPTTTEPAKTPAPRPPIIRSHRPYRPHATHGHAGGYAIYARPYRTYHTLGYEAGNDIGFEGLDFNFPGSDNRRRGARHARYPVGWGPVCKLRPAYDPDGGLWESPFDYNCW